jgi:S1-C subfamily serine protease
VIEAPDTNHDNRTVHVVHLAADSPVSKSGIQVGDTVMRIDSREIYRPSDVQDASFFSHVGGNMTVVVRRDDKLYNYSFSIIERPANTIAVPTPAMTAAPAPSAKPMLVNREEK